MRSNLFAGLVLLATSTVAQADSFMFECTYHSRGRGGWIPETAYYVVYEDKAIFAIVDKLTQHANDGSPVIAALEQPGRHAYAAHWNLVLKTRRNAEVAVAYRVRIDARRGTAQIRAKVGDSDTDPFGAAKCTRQAAPDLP